MALGMGMVLTPLALPIFSPWICQPFYWCGAIPLLFGVFVVDLAVLAIFWRHLNGRWAAFRRIASRRQAERHL